MSFHWIRTKHSISIKTKLKTYAYLAGEKIEKIVICMHGYGDNAENISHLAQAFQMNHILFLFVQGPTPVQMNFSGFQWFDLFHDPHKKIEESASLILDLFKHLTDDHKIASHKIYFMGFSQGAAMAIYCGLRTQQKIGGIIGLSGFLVHTAQLLDQTNLLYKECPMLLMHGSDDQTIFPILFFEAHAILENMGFKNILTKIYPMGHTICPEEINEIKQFLIT